MKALGKGSVASIVQTGLGIARVLLWIGFVLLTLAAVGLLITAGLAASGLLPSDILTSLEQNVHVSSDDGFDYHGPMTWPVMLGAFLAGFVAIGGALVIVGRLRKLFANFCSGEPFHKANADHLRAIWIALLVIELSRYVLMALIGALFAAFGGPPGQSASLSIHIDLSTWFAILILIVLAEVFREGARMREEQELTV